jgi:hypothetical protein
MPAPPASASRAKTSRTSVTSTPRACAIPAQTPAITRSSSLVAKERSDMPGHRTPRVTRSSPAPDMGVEDEDRAPFSVTLSSTLCPSAVLPRR